MRQAGKGFGSKMPFQINELEEKSHFSPPEPSYQQPHSNAQKQQSLQPKDSNENLKDQTGQQHQQQDKQQAGKDVPNKHQMNFQIPFQLQNGLIEGQSTQNANLKFTKYTFLMYLGILLYLIDFFVLIIPGLKQGQKIKQTTEVVLGISFLLVVFIMILSYEKARRSSPGYPLGLDHLLRVPDAKLAVELPELSELKNHTMALLIRKAQIKELLQKDPSQKNQQILESFEYMFFVKETKWCDKCLNIKRPRVRHCSDCDRCVQRMDHHCVWLSNCVGRKNHKLFMLFLFFLILILTFFTTIGILELIDSEASVTTYLETRHGAFWKIVYIIGEILAVGLWLYYLFVFCQQLYLILNNLTFVESLSNILLEKKPWKKSSFCDNLREVFGQGCWICPTEIKYGTQLKFWQEKDRKNPSVELVQQVQGGSRNPMTNFESEHHFRHQRNQI